MKRKQIIGITDIVLGLLIAIGPHTIFHVCRPDGGMLMHCNYTAYAESITGAVIVLIGIAVLFVKSRTAQKIFSIVQAVLAVLVFSFPVFIIGVCENVHMHCHAVALPALIILSIILFAVSFIDIIYSGVKKDKANAA